MTISVTNLHKRYGERVAVDDVSFEAGPGDILGIVGPNGAGKTTTVECIEGLRTPDGGAISVFGLDPRRDRRALRQVLGAQLQELELPERLRVDEAIRLYASFYRDPADPDELLEAVGLVAHRRVAYASLSGGQKQRLSIALAFVGRPRAVVLDELTRGLDAGGRRDVWELIGEMRDRGVTMLLVTHDLDEAERLCDRIAVIVDGRVVALDTPAGLVERVGLGQRVRFRPRGPLDTSLFDSLGRVGEVAWERDEVVVSGRGDVAQAVLGLLTRHGIVTDRLAVDGGRLDEAYLALTGSRHEKGAA